MKLFKGLLAIAIVSLVAISCNETKKEAQNNTQETVETSADKTNEVGKVLAETSVSNTKKNCAKECSKDSKTGDGNCKSKSAKECSKDNECMKSGACDGSCHA